jgi:hypothetical protein
MFRDLTRLSGFGYNGEVPTCPENVWETYLKSHPGGAKFRKRRLENFDELDELYSGSAATGEHARKAASLVYTNTAHTQSGSSPQPSPAPSAHPSLSPERQSTESQSKLSSRQSNKRRRQEGSSAEPEESSGEKKKQQRSSKAVKAATTTNGTAGTGGFKTRAERSGKEKSAGKQLAGAMGEVAEVSRQVDFRLENAVTLFHEEYVHQFEPRECFVGENLLGEEKNARIFITLPPGKYRDYWITQMIQEAMGGRSV